MLLCRITTYESTREIKNLSLIWFNGVAFLRRFSGHSVKGQLTQTGNLCALMSVEALHPCNSSRVSQRVRIPLKTKANKMDGCCSRALNCQQQHKNMIIFFSRLLVWCCQVTAQFDERHIYSQLSRFT